MRRWSCSTILFKYLTWRSRENRHSSRSRFMAPTTSRIGRVLVDRDRAWVPRVRLTECFAEEPLGGRRIPLGREQEVDRLAAAVHGAIQVSPPALHLDGCLIDPPRAIARTQM